MFAYNVTNINSPLLNLPISLAPCFESLSVLAKNDLQHNVLLKYLQMCCWLWSCAPNVCEVRCLLAWWSSMMFFDVFVVVNSKSMCFNELFPYNVNKLHPWTQTSALVRYFCGHDDREKMKWISRWWRRLHCLKWSCF